MKAVRRLVRFFGWLLTPLVAWAASFLGASVAASLTAGLSARRALWVTLAVGAVAALSGAWLWLRFLRRSPSVQQTLQVTADGTPMSVVQSEAGQKP